jgi:hypothetical protein
MTYLRVMLTSALLLGNSVLFASESNQVDFNDYTVHFNAFPSDHLNERVAKVIGVERDLAHAIITIVVNKKDGKSLPKSVKANIHGNAFNLTGMMRKLKLREVEDHGAIYYVSDFGVRDGEHLTFAMTVQPQGEKFKKNFKFDKKF